MPTLYDVLGIEPNAPPDEVRKAYRKRALQTHPDRLGPNPTPQQKTEAEDQFRKVNAAYEVLSDPNNRRQYDVRGVWPPPEPVAEDLHSRTRHESFGPAPHRYHGYHRHHHMPPVDPLAGFFGQDVFTAFGGAPRSHRTFHYTDPFVLFNEIMGDLQESFLGDQFFHPHVHPLHRHSSTSTPFVPMFVAPPPPFAFLGGGAPTFQSTSYRSSNRGGQWVSESRSTRTINGVTETICKCKDANGNEHITQTFGDGSTRYTLNGVEQPHMPAQALPASNRPIQPSHPPLPPPPPSVRGYSGYNTARSYEPLEPPLSSTSSSSADRTEKKHRWRPW